MWDSMYVHHVAPKIRVEYLKLLAKKYNEYSLESLWLSFSSNAILLAVKMISEEFKKNLETLKNSMEVVADYISQMEYDKLQMFQVYAQQIEKLPKREQPRALGIVRAQIEIYGREMIGYLANTIIKLKKKKTTEDSFRFAILCMKRVEIQISKRLGKFKELKWPEATDEEWKVCEEVFLEIILQGKLDDMENKLGLMTTDERFQLSVRDSIILMNEILGTQSLVKD